MLNILHVKTPEDYQMALEVRRAVFIDEQKISEEIEIDSYEKESHHFLALLDGVPVGAARVRIKENKVKFERIATLKEFRAQGIGTLLLEKMQNFSREVYPRVPLYMHAQQGAIDFYIKRGWKPIGDIFYEANIPHQVLVLN